VGVSWDGSSRRARLPANWAALRGQVLERDGYQCTRLLPNGTRCPNRATDVDHENPMTDDHSPERLHSLCSQDHREKSSREGGQAMGAIRKRMAAARWRPKEVHPGLRRESS
jgi:5-methylcytosine-specific restriction protein A